MRVRTGRFNEDEQARPCAKDLYDSCRAESLVFAGPSLLASSEYACERVEQRSNGTKLGWEFGDSDTEGPRGPSVCLHVLPSLLDVGRFD
jgi:hypothetical protein